MSAPSQVDAGEIWLGLFSTAAENGLYQADDVTFAQLAQFIRKLTVGDATKDSDDYISSYVMGDFTGGGQRQILNEGADAGRFYVAFLDTTAANRTALGPLVTKVRPNANCAKSYPLDVGNDGIAYDAFNESGTWEVWGLNETSGAYDYNAGAGVALGSEPVGKSVRFDGVIYVPRGIVGGGGYSRVTGSAGVPTVAAVAGSADPTTAAPTSAPRPVCFCVFQQKLWCITAEGGIAYHTIAQKDAGSNAWTWPFALTTTDFPRIEASTTALNMAVFPDKNGVESLYVKTDRGLLIFDDNNGLFLETHVEFPPHPDVNQSFAVWPSGGDLHAPVGLAVPQYSTAFVFDPHKGLARDHGLPSDLRGAITDIEPAMDRLYAMVGGVSETSTAYAYSSKIENSLSSPKQIARDSDGNLYVADFGNDKVQKYTVGTTTWSDFATSLDEVTGVCVDSSGNVYVAFKNGTDDYRVRSYDSGGTLRWTSATLATGPTRIGHVATDGTHVYVAAKSEHEVKKLLCSTGAVAATWGAVDGAGDGQFSFPYGIAYSPVTGTLFIGDQGNDRIQEITTGGAFVRKWGSSGTGDGQFVTPTGIAVDASGNVFVADSGRDDVQQFTSTGAFLRKFGAAGTGDGQLSVPDDVAVEADGDVWVADDSTTDRIQAFALQTTSSATVTSYWSLWVYTGIGWHGLARGDSTSTIPTHLKATAATGAYRLRWGASDGYIAHIKLRRTFHNAAIGSQAGIDEFSPGGSGVSYLETGDFDAAMQGFDKIASHLIFLDATASATETITTEFRIDGGGWETLGVVNATGRTALPFGLIDGFSRGRNFNKIAFRFTMARGGTITATPVIDAVSLHFTKIPQNTTSFNLSIPLTDYKGRSAAEQYNDLVALLETREFLQLVHRRDSYDSDGNEVGATYRVLMASLAGQQDTGGGFHGRADLSLIAIPDGQEEAA